MASRGLRDMGNGPEAIPDEDIRQVRSQAREVHRQALLAAVLTTVLVWFAGPWIGIG